MLDQLSEEEQIRARQREQRRRQMQLEKRKQMQRREAIRKRLPYVAGAILVLFIVIAGMSIFHSVTRAKERAESIEDTNEVSNAGVQIPQSIADAEINSAAESILEESGKKTQKTPRR